MAGLLDFATDPQSAMMTQMALGLLSAGGPSSRPVSLGQAMGQAGQMGMQGYKDAQTNQVNQMKLDELKKRMAFMQNMPNMEDPNFINQALQSGAVDLNTALPLMMKDKEKPELVELDDPANPGRTVKKWVTPGKSDGTNIGYAPMKTPEGMRYDNGQLVGIPGYVDMKKQIAAAGRPTSNVMVNVEQKGRTKLSELDAETINEMGKNATQAMRAIPEIDRMIKNEGNAYSGILAPGLTGLAATADALGFATPEIKSKLVSSQLFAQGADAYAASMLKALMGSSQLSNADTMMVKKIAPQLASTPEARRELMAYARQRVLQMNDDYQSARNYYDKNNASLTGYQIPLPATLAPSQPTPQPAAPLRAPPPLLNVPVPSFRSEQEAAAAGIKSGTRIKINGVMGTWQ